MASARSGADEERRDKWFRLAERLVNEMDKSAKNGYVYSIADIKNTLEKSLKIPERTLLGRTGKERPNPEFQLVIALAKLLANENGIPWGASRR